MTVHLSTPEVITQLARPYVAIGATVTMKSIDEVVPALLGEVMAWAEDHAEPAGAPFVRYRVIDMASLLVIEVGVPVAESVLGGGRVEAGLLPAGRYLRATHTLGPSTGSSRRPASSSTELPSTAWSSTRGAPTGARLAGTPRALPDRPRRRAGPVPVGDRARVPPERLTAHLRPR